MPRGAGVHAPAARPEQLTAVLAPMQALANTALNVVLCSSAQELQVALGLFLKKRSNPLLFWQAVFCPWLCFLNSCLVHLGVTACGYHWLLVPAGSDRRDEDCV